MEKPPRLVRLEGHEPDEELPIFEGRTRVGRTRGLEIFLRDTAVSRLQCTLVRQGEEVRVHSAPSQNPTLVNGKAAEGQVLRDGDVLTLGRGRFVYRGSSPAPSSVPPAPAAPSAAPAAEGGSPPSGGERAAPARGPVRKVAAASRLRPRPARAPRAALVTLLGGMALLAALAASAWGSWLFLRGPSPSSPESAAGAVPSSPVDPILAAALKTAEYRQEISRLEAQRSEENRRQIEVLMRQVTELEGEIARFRAPSTTPGAPASSPPERKEASVALPEPPAAAPPSASPSAGAARTPPGEAAPAARTVQVPAPTGGRKLSPRDLAEVVARLRARMDDYATGEVLPASLEPDLAVLAGAVGKEPGEALLALHDHCRDLIKEVESSLEQNRRRFEGLLTESKQARPHEEREKAPGKVATAPPAPSAGREADQRLLELSHKAWEIQKGQRDLLLPLRDAVLKAIARTADPRGLELFQIRLANESDPGLFRAILAAFEKGGHQEAGPLLVRKLAVASDPGLRAALRQTLTTLAGVDLGESPAAWARWWGGKRLGNGSPSR